MERETAIARSAEAIRRYDDHHILIEAGPAPVIDRLATAPPVPGPLENWTYVVKDMIDVAGLPTTRGSTLYGTRPALAHAPCVELLERAGALLVGKANQHEFAWGVTSENPHWGDVRNPRHPHLTPGGSSGGTGAAIAAGIARFGLGTDTGGSVRMPAAACGVVGLRPRAGGISDEGVAALAPRFDRVGPMAGSVADVTAVWEVLSGSSVAPLASLDGWRVAVAEGCGQAGDFVKLGAVLGEVALPYEAAESYRTILGAQASRVHEGTYPVNAGRYSDGVRRKLEEAAAITPAAYAEAVGRLEAARAAFEARIEAFDLLVMPTLGAQAARVGCDEAAVRGEVGRITAIISALGLPALAIGDLQLVGRTEEAVLRAGLAWESLGLPVPEPR